MNRSRRSQGTSERRDNGTKAFIEREFEKRRQVKRKRMVVEQEPPCDAIPMCGYYVNVPQGVRPYKSQKMMIVKILTALKLRQNVMVESPTGSGKTLGLLSSTCAWLHQYKKDSKEARLKCPAHGENSTKAVPVFVPPLKNCVNTTVDTITLDDEEREDSVVGDISPIRKRHGETQNMNTPRGFRDVSDTITSPLSNNGGFREVMTIREQEEAQFDSDWVGVTPKSKTPFDFSSDVPIEEIEEQENNKVDTPECTCLPRIRLYYSSRTHKQIAQVVKEFSRLSYGHHLKHTILGSREQLCVHPGVRGTPDMTSKCKELISNEGGPNCQFRDNMKQKFGQSNPKQAGFMRETVLKNGAPVVWDVEDLKDALTYDHRSAMCPYFTSTRLLTVDADIIFCPFSYLIDPIIRESSDVHLKNSVVILDEAHNVEDFCRDAATFTFTDKEVIDACHSFEEKLISIRSVLKRNRDDLSNYEQIADVNEETVKLAGQLAQLEQHGEYMKTVLDFANHIFDWLKETAEPALGKIPCTGLQRQQPKVSHNFSYADMYTSLEHHKLLLPPDSEYTKRLMCAYGNVASGGREEGDEQNHLLAEFKPRGEAIVCVEKVIHFMTFFCPDDNKTTYRLNVTIERTYSSDFGSHSTQSFDSTQRFGGGPKNVAYSQNVFLDSRHTSSELSHKPPILVDHKTSVGLWCMSPSLAFNGALSACHSVILASGTLTPADTFESELAMNFKHKMEGDQVIPQDRIFACVVNYGPSGHRLVANYQNTSGQNNLFATELAKIVMSVCVRTPGGVLCFFPSYRLMERVKEFMESRESGSMMDQLCQIKHVVYEPRRSSDLNSVMETFENAIRFPRTHGVKCTGAIMFAVFRGKVSEGIDFADDLARCVISVGIPFPSAYDDMVIEKKKYNNENSKTRNLLSGDQWYTTQAYRALNQALGRCLRHRNDWGSLVLVDDRLMPQMNPQQPTKISKWIRSQLHNYPNFSEFLNVYEDFVSRLTTQSEESTQKVSNVADVTVID